MDKGLTRLIHCPSTKAGSLTIPATVTSIDAWAFAYCGGLTNITLPPDLAGLRNYTFLLCSGLQTLTIPKNVTALRDGCFALCSSLQSVFFQGNAPTEATQLFERDDNATVYYLPGTAGWGPTFGGRPTMLWNPQIQTSGPGFGVGPGGFGFSITGTTNIPIVVEACTSLTSSNWVALQSLNLTNGMFYFSDANWVNFPARIYRIRSP